MISKGHQGGGAGEGRGGSQILVSDTWEVCKNWKLEGTDELGISVEKFQTRVTETEDQGERGHRGDAEDLSQGDRENDINWWRQELLGSSQRLVNLIVGVMQGEMAAYTSGNFQHTVGVYFQKTMYGC